MNVTLFLRRHVVSSDSSMVFIILSMTFLFLLLSMALPKLILFLSFYIKPNIKARKILRSPMCSRVFDD